MTSPTSEPKPVYLLRGDDPVLQADALRTLLTEVLADEDDPGLATEDLTIGTEGDAPVSVAQVLDACLTPPFLTESRVVVVRNAGAFTADDGARLAVYLGTPLSTTVLVLVGAGGTVPAKLVNAVKSAGEVRGTDAPTRAADRRSWVVDRLKDGPVRFDAPAGQAIVEHLGEDLGRLHGLMEVLAARYGDGARVGLDELAPFLGDAGAVAPWDLTDAIDRGDQAAALDYLRRMTRGGERHPMVVLATLHRHVASMLRLDGANVTNEAEAAAVLGLKGSTFPARKALNQARKLGASKVRRAITLVAAADLDLRGAKAWPDDLVLEILVARLCQLARG